MSARPMREEWAIRHSQGTYAGSTYGRGLTEAEAREWLAESRAKDERRQRQARGQQRLLRRFVTDWEQVDDA